VNKEVEMNLINRIEPGWLRTNDTLSRPEERERRRQRRERNSRKKDEETSSRPAEDEETVLDLVA
jgi:hypothetical protein